MLQTCIAKKYLHYICVAHSNSVKNKFQIKGGNKKRILQTKSILRGSKMVTLGRFQVVKHIFGVSCALDVLY